MAAKKLGLKEVPILFVEHLTEAQKRAYIIADNRLALDASYRDWETDRKSTRLNSSHITRSRMPSSA